MGWTHETAQNVWRLAPNQQPQHTSDAYKMRLLLLNSIKTLRFWAISIPPSCCQISLHLACPKKVLTTALRFPWLRYGSWTASMVPDHRETIAKPSCPIITKIGQLWLNMIARRLKWCTWRPGIVRSMRGEFPSGPYCPWDEGPAFIRGKAMAWILEEEGTVALKVLSTWKRGSALVASHQSQLSPTIYSITTWL